MHYRIPPHRAQYLWQRFNLIVSVPFFQNIHPHVIQEIVVNLGVEVYLPGDYVINKEDWGNCMYFIYTGQCDVIVPLSAQEVAQQRTELSQKQRRSETASDSPSEARRKSSTLGISSMRRSSLFHKLKNLGSVKERQDESDSENSQGSLDSTTESGRYLKGRFGSPNSSPSRAHSSESSKKSPVSDNGRDKGDYYRGSGSQSPPNYKNLPRISPSPKSLISKFMTQEKKKELKNYKVVATLNAGQYFGEVALVLRSRRTASIRSRLYCEVCVLTRDIYNKVAELYPEDALEMRNIILSKYSNIKHASGSVRSSLRNIIEGAGGSSRAMSQASSSRQSSRAQSQRDLLRGTSSISKEFADTMKDFKTELGKIESMVDSAYEEEILTNNTIGAMQVKILAALEEATRH